MQIIGYKCRKAFWRFVSATAVPHVRLNARVVKFPEAALQEWLSKRTAWLLHASWLLNVPRQIRIGVSRDFWEVRCRYL